VKPKVALPSSGVPQQSVVLAARHGSKNTPIELDKEGVDWNREELSSSKTQMDYLEDERMRLLADPRLFGPFGKYRAVEALTLDGSLI
jgi:hypothetical protein